MSEIDHQSADAALAIKALTSLSNVTSTPPHNARPPPTPSSSGFPNNSPSYVSIQSYPSNNFPEHASIIPLPITSVQPTRQRRSPSDTTVKSSNIGSLVNNPSTSSPPLSSPVSNPPLSTPFPSSTSYTTEAHPTNPASKSIPSKRPESPANCYQETLSTPPHASSTSSSPPSSTAPAKIKNGNARNKKPSSRKTVTFNEALRNKTAPNPSSPDESEIYSLDAGVIRCICGFDEDDGFTIQCEKCNAWQHAVCVNIENDQVPEVYLCDRCGKLSYDIEAARKYQERRIHVLKLRNSHRDFDEGDNAARSRRPKETIEKSSRNSAEQPDQPSESSKLAEDSLPSKRRKSGDDEKDSKRTSISERGSSAGASPKGTSSRASPVSLNSESAGTNISTASATSHTRRGRGKRLTVPNSRLTSKDDANDNDIEPEKKFTLAQIYNSYFVPINQNRYFTPEVHRYVDEIIKPGQDSDISMRYTHQEFKSIKQAEVAVKLTSDHPKQKFSGFSRFGLFLERSVSKDRFIINYVGEVLTKTQYKCNPINQYRRFGCPKPGVLFHPNLPISIDARQVGSKARFMRRSCTPNCKVNTVVVDEKHVLFAAFSEENIKAGTELTVAWEWDENHPARKLIADIPPEQLSKEERDFLVQAANMVHQRGAECACSLAASDCLLGRMKRANGVPPRNTRIGSKTRRGVPNSDSSCLDSGVEGDVSSGVFGTEMSDSANFYSSREARKMQSAMELIERLSRREESKKRKRDIIDETEDDTPSCAVSSSGIPNNPVKPIQAVLDPPSSASSSGKLATCLSKDKAIQTLPIVVPLRTVGVTGTQENVNASLDSDPRLMYTAARSFQRKRVLHQYLRAKQIYTEAHPSGSRQKAVDSLLSGDIHVPISLPSKSSSIFNPSRISAEGKSAPSTANGSAIPNGTFKTTPNVSLPSSPHLPHHDSFPVRRIPSKPPTPVPGSPLTTPVATPTFDPPLLNQSSNVSNFAPIPVPVPVAEVKQAAVTPALAASSAVPVAKTVKKLSFADYKKKKTSTTMPPSK